MNSMKMCNVLLAMVLTGGLVSHAQVSSAQTDTSSVGSADATTELDDNDHRGGCKSQSDDDHDRAQNWTRGKCTNSREQLFEQGKAIFRFDTFGDERQWTDALRMHEVISSAVDPTTALSVGLKVDADALPPAVVDGIKNGSVDLKSPATTIALLKLDAVVGLKGTVESVNGVDRLTRVGITCALCHSTVDESFAPGIGTRLDGWANRDLNPGAIIAPSPTAPKTSFRATWPRCRRISCP